jgi:hypothetical protein
MTVETARHAAIDDDLSDWSVAEFLDTPLADGLILRALVCRLGAGKWQWSISSMGVGIGELISMGVESSAAGARLTAASEIEKCLDNAIG